MSATVQRTARRSTAPRLPPRRALLRPRGVPAWSIAAALALAYLIIAPPSPDLAAASYRASLFAREGFALWDNAWYGGHHLLAYSVLAPPLGSVVAPRLIAAVSMTAATALFAALIEGAFAPRATRIAAAWFALGAGVALLSSRVPFDLGLAIGLGSLLAARRGHPRTALALAVLTSLASPVAGAFLALVVVAWMIVAPRRALPGALALAALTPIALLALAFPEGGTQPFVASAFYPALAAVLVVAALIPSEQRLLRVGALLYAAVLIAAYLLPTAVGGNADRLGALAAGPVAACALAGGPLRAPRTLALIALAPFLLYWQVNAPIADFSSAEEDPAVAASFYRPLIGELRALGVSTPGSPARIEVVPTKAHWEARWMPPAVMLARGWERQLDRQRNGLFYDGRTLSAARYQAWLQREGIAYVALPSAPLDYSARGESRLLAGARPPAYLSEIWRTPRWRLFAVRDPHPLAQPPAVLTSLGSAGFTLRVPRPGTYTVLVHFTSYWALAAGRGCVEEAPGDWTQVRAPAPGSYHVLIAFSLARVFERGPRCR